MLLIFFWTSANFFLLDNDRIRAKFLSLRVELMLLKVRELYRFIKAEGEKWGTVIKNRNIRVD